MLLQGAPGKQTLQKLQRIPVANQDNGARAGGKRLTFAGVKPPANGKLFQDPFYHGRRSRGDLGRRLDSELVVVRAQGVERPDFLVAGGIVAAFKLAESTLAEISGDLGGGGGLCGREGGREGRNRTQTCREHAGENVTIHTKK